MEQDNPHAAAIYRSIGVYLGHTLAFYYDLYHCRHVLLLGRVMSGQGGRHHSGHLQEGARRRVP